MLEPARGMRRGAETEQGGAAEQFQPGWRQHRIQPIRILLQPDARGFCPFVISIGGGAGGKRLGGDRPVPEGGADFGDDGGPAMMKPSRTPARPKNLPKERSTISRSCAAPAR